MTKSWYGYGFETMGTGILLLDHCLKNYTILWNIWTYQLLCKKKSHNLCKIVHKLCNFSYTTVRSFICFTVLCMICLNSGLTVYTDRKFCVRVRVWVRVLYKSVSLKLILLKNWCCCVSGNHWLSPFLYCCRPTCYFFLFLFLFCFLFVFVGLFNCLLLMTTVKFKLCKSLL